MSKEEQARAYLRESRLTLESARAVFRTAEETETELWAQVVKNGYDAIEQATSAGLAARDESIPHRHPAKIDAFVEAFDPPDDIEQSLLTWLRRRSSSQYVDVRGDEITVPHEQFDRRDAERILEDAETVLEFVRDRASFDGTPAP